MPMQFGNCYLIILNEPRMAQPEFVPMSTTLDLSLDYLPRLPKRKDFRIGCIGSGFIMADCHLVAYKQAGFQPVAIASQTAAHADRVAKRHGLKAYATAEELLADKSIEVLDIAVPPDIQIDVIRAAVKQKSH